MKDIGGMVDQGDRKTSPVTVRETPQDLTRRQLQLTFRILYRPQMIPSIRQAPVQVGLGRDA